MILRRAEWAGPAHGRWLLNFVFYVGLPILIFGALTGATLSREHAVLPAIAVCTGLVGWAAAAFLARRFGLPKKSEGAMSLCAMSMNIAMIYPFASLSLGTAAFSQLVMFDMGHAVMAWTLTTVVACKYGGHTDDIPVLLRRALAAPPLWILFLALGLNVADAPISDALLHEILVVGQLLVLLVPLAMGLLVSAAGMRRREVITSVVLRSVLGGARRLWPGAVVWSRRHRGRNRGAGCSGSRRIHGRGAFRSRRTRPRTRRRARRRFRFSWDRCGFRSP